GRGRQEKALHVGASDDRLPEAEEGDEHGERGNPVAGAPPEHRRDAFLSERHDRDGRRCHATPSASDGASPLPRWSASRTSVASSKKRGSSRVACVRGCGRPTGITLETRPGRGDITTTRVERKTASAIECVTKTTVDLLASQICSNSMFRRSRVISSRAPNGSSIKSSAGSNESARAIETRCCIPPERCHGQWF